MAVFATDAVIDIKIPGLLRIARIKRMANKAFGSMGRVRSAQARRAKDLGNALRHRVIQYIPGLCMLVLQHPGAVLVLQNFGLLAGLNRAVASRGTTGAGADIAGFCR